MRRLLLIGLLSTGCARNWVNYPPMVAYDGKGGRHIVSARAAEFNGSDVIGGTVIDVTRGGVRITANEGINNSRSTEAGYRTLRYGMGAAAWAAGAVAIANAASGAAEAINASNNAANTAGAKTAAGVAQAKIGAGVQTQAIKAGVNAIPR